MLFTSALFAWVYLPVVLAGFFAIGRWSEGGAALWLFVASLVFYAAWIPGFTLLLLASIVFNFVVGRRIGSTRSRTWLTVGVASNLSLLAYFKYAGFLVTNVNALTGAHWDLGRIILPIGISFFTFTQIAFLVDTWRGEAREPSFAKYLLFVTYFPHLIAGPILHHKQMIPQFESPSVLRMRADSIAVGMTMLTIGLFKKVVLADHFAEYANPVFTAGASGAPLGMAEAWVGALAYSLQLYFDFSGYSDMAIGLSRLFNIDLPLNFNSPYKSANIIEFWRRWHISLSTFLRDYLYIPLGGNRFGKVRRYVNLFLTMLLGGLWHGANWTFVAWGAIHGGLLIVNHAFAALQDRVRWLRMPRTVAIALTFLAVVLAWVPFRAENFEVALRLWQAMFVLPPGSDWLAAAGSGIRVHRAAYAIFGGLLIVWLLPNTQEFMSRHWRNSNDSTVYATRIAWRPAVWVGVCLGAAFAFVVMSFGRVSEFLYFQF